MMGRPKVAEYKEVPDHELLHHIALVKEGALEALYARHSTSVFSLAMFMLRQQPLAEEVTQDVFLNIWLKAATYKADRGEPKAWIMSIAHHRIVDVIRSRRRTPAISEPREFDLLELLPSRGASTEEEVERNLDRDRIVKALASLPEAQQGLFSYFLMKGMEGDADANGDNKITAGELHAFVAASVARQAPRLGTDQTPQIAGDPDRVLVGLVNHRALPRIDQLGTKAAVPD